MRDLLALGVLVTCLLIELMYPVLTNVRAAWRDFSEVMLDVSDAHSVQAPPSSPIADLFRFGDAEGDGSALTAGQSDWNAACIESIETALRVQCPASTGTVGAGRFSGMPPLDLRRSR